jgi:hypothetical protein
MTDVYGGSAVGGGEAADGDGGHGGGDGGGSGDRMLRAFKCISKLAY